MADLTGYPIQSHDILGGLKNAGTHGSLVRGCFFPERVSLMEFIHYSPSSSEVPSWQDYSTYGLANQRIRLKYGPAPFTSSSLYISTRSRFASNRPTAPAACVEIYRMKVIFS